MEIKAMTIIRCARCAGTGEIAIPNPSEPTIKSDGTMGVKPSRILPRYVTVDGFGTIRTGSMDCVSLARCPYCKGTGEVEAL